MGSLLLICVLLISHKANGIFFDGPLLVPKFTRVQSPAGEIVGKIDTVQFDAKQYTVKSFLGIPYAEAPIGNNRFRKPVPKAPFASPYAALDYGAACLQRPNGAVGTVIPMAEDCLSLNVFVPQIAVLQTSKLLPVMVWIHGGGFVSGTSTDYPGEYLSGFGEVIVVTVNYRLGHMGFLRTKETVANFGLWDQHLAIKWVNDNIGSFGGDVNNVTIFGESAGSSSVVYQVLFPNNKGFFQRAIAQSGGVTSPWAFTPNRDADIIFQNFTAEIGCALKDHALVMACLRNKTPDAVANVMKSKSLNVTNVVPNLDNDFVPQHPQEMILPSMAKQSSLDVFYDIDFMMGSCSIDGAVYLGSFAAYMNISDLEDFKIPRDIYETVYIKNTLASIFSNIQSIPQSANDVTIFQYTNWTSPDYDIARNRKLVDLVTDAGMFVPMVAMSRLHTKGTKGNTYMYRFAIAPTTHLLSVPSWLESPTNANHADDVMFVFGFPKQGMDIWHTDGSLRATDQDIKSAKVVMSMWTNFAKTGNPNKPYSVPTQWPQYNMTSQSYLDITPTMTPSSVQQRIAAKRMTLWLDLLPSLLQTKK